MWKEIIRQAVTIVPIAAGIAHPSLGRASKVIIDAILEAEDLGGKTGPEKAIRAQGIVAKSAPEVIADMEKLFGKEVVDEALLKRYLEKQQDATVDLLNAFGMLPKKQ